MSQAKHTMTELRGHLFDTIERLKADENPMEARTAEAICKAAGRLIETAEVEIKFRSLIARESANGASKFLTDQS